MLNQSSESFTAAPLSCDDRSAFPPSTNDMRFTSLVALFMALVLLAPVRAQDPTPVEHIATLFSDDACTVPAVDGAFIDAWTDVCSAYQYAGTVYGVALTGCEEGVSADISFFSDLSCDSAVFSYTADVSCLPTGDGDYIQLTS